MSELVCACPARHGPAREQLGGYAREGQELDQSQKATLSLAAMRPAESEHLRIELGIGRSGAGHASARLSRQLGGSPHAGGLRGSSSRPTELKILRKRSGNR